MFFSPLNLSLVLFMSLLFSACGSSQKELTDSEKKAELYYTFGTEKLVEKNYTEALDSLSKANALSPHESRIHNNLGMAYYFKSKLGEAEKHLKIAIQEDAKNSDARNNLASLYFSKGELDKAKTEYQKILEDLVYAHQYRTYYNLALISLKENETNDAIALLEKSLKERHDYCSAHFKLGEIYRQKHSFAKALERFKEAGKGDCTNIPGPVYEQGITLVMMRKYEQAREKFHEVLERFHSSNLAPLASMQLKKLPNPDNSEETASNMLSENKINFSSEVNSAKKPKAKSDSTDDEMNDADLEEFESPGI